MLKDYQKILLDLFSQMELEIANLYKLFAEKFSTHKDLWLELSDGEIKNAYFIKELHSLAEQGIVIFNEKTTKTYTVKAIIDDIKNKYNKTLENQYTIVNALSFSNSMEQSHVKSKFYEYFSSSDRETIMMINDMKSEFITQSNKIKKAWEEAKTKGWDNFPNFYLSAVLMIKLFSILNS